MQYINPYDLLGFERSISLSELTSDVIKRSKKHLLIEIELNENRHLYRGVEFTKADCNKAIDDLDDDEKRRFHYFIFQNKNLNDFLVEGSLPFFERHQLESIYNVPEFVTFLSSFFTPKFDKALLKAFQSNNDVLLKSILKYQYLISSKDINEGFRSLNNELRRRIEIIDELRDEIEKGNIELGEKNFSGPLNVVELNFPIESLNALPRYFQTLIDQAAESMNYLQLAMGSAYETKLAILTRIKALKIESVSAKTYKDNFEIVKNRLDERLEQEQNMPILKKWADSLLQINEFVKVVDDKTVKSNTLVKKVNAIVNISELNQLPSFANEIRNQIGYSLRSLAISTWNAQNDIDTALFFINAALQINVSKDARDKFTTDINELTRIKLEKEKRGEPMESAPSLKTVNGIGTTIYGNTLYFVIFGIPIIPLGRYNCTPTLNGYRFHGKLRLHKWQKIWQGCLLGGIVLWILIAIIQSNNSSSASSYANSSATNSYQSSTDTAASPSANSSSTYSSSSSNSNTDSATSGLPSEPAYIAVPMKNGNISDCIGFTPKYDYDINNKLIISADMTDAAVKIINYETDQCIRFVFIKDGTTYTARHIPEGKYYLKIAYGHDWSVKNGDPPCTGRFLNQASYKKDTDLYDFNKQYDNNGNISIPYYTLKLYRTFSADNSTSNSTENAISENEFFNN